MIVEKYEGIKDLLMEIIKVYEDLLNLYVINFYVFVIKLWIRSFVELM